MKNANFTIGFSVFGFLLSLVSGLCSTGNYFGRMVLHAVMFAAVFAVIAVVIQFLFGRFFGSDVDFSEGTAPSAEPASSGNHVVDITVQDEELPTDENSSQFYVGSNRNMLNPNDSSEMKTDTPEKPAVKTQNSEMGPVQNAIHKEVASANVAGAGTASPSSGFVPISLGETPSNVASVEAQSHNEIKKEEKIASMGNAPVDSSVDGELDTLPDLEDLSGYATSVPSAAVAEGTEVVENSDFSRNGPDSSVSAEEITDGKDAQLMAKAISTLLAKE